MNKRSFKAQLRYQKKPMTLYLRRVEKKDPSQMDTLCEPLNHETWKEVDCLACANCCKTMTPTYTQQDIRRIANYLGMKKQELIDKYLKFDKKEEDWQNKKQPCQWLDLQTNLCSIYEVRPADCAGFPHLTKKHWTDYTHVHKQNINYCPATFTFVQKMMAALPM